MTPHTDMAAAPKDGTRILLKYRTHCYYVGTHFAMGFTWRECRWIDDKEESGSDAHWEPWGGAENVHTTLLIPAKDAVAWMPLPPEDYASVDGPTAGQCDDILGRPHYNL